jgi:hypothetical protein
MDCSVATDDDTTTIPVEWTDIGIVSSLVFPYSRIDQGYEYVGVVVSITA